MHLVPFFTCSTLSGCKKLKFLQYKYATAYNYKRVLKINQQYARTLTISLIVYAVLGYLLYESSQL